MSDLVAISPSRLKTFKSCSWLYYCKYILKLPDKTNSGALKGTCCHNIFEFLLERKDVFDELKKKKQKSLSNSPLIERYVRKYCLKYDLSEEDYDDIENMIFVGLENDFYCSKAKKVLPELDFDLTNENPKYRIKGFIDKIAFYKDGSIKMIDYKSSKKKFEGEEKEFNLQALIYTLAAKKMYEKFKSKIEFLFLKFPDDPALKIDDISDGVLEGLESYLEEASNALNNFGEKEAYSNFASKQDFPKKGFGGPLQCGFAKYKGQLKKDGSVMWHCPCKFDFEYYALLDEEGEVIQSSLNKEDLEDKKKEDYFIVKKNYKGCPMFIKTIE